MLFFLNVKKQYHIVFLLSYEVFRKPTIHYSLSKFLIHAVQKFDASNLFSHIIGGQMLNNYTKYSTYIIKLNS